ncbi:MAG: YedE-related selenium metabolism membrane protein [Krumholzibacteria bacterium]|nr:YedE-related selenium metabolism membrane protein [Candidatus Krumholzibacteria bacterium]
MELFFASRRGVISAGAIIGIIAAVLQKLGNPGNMGLCMACFERDTAGALGFHRVGALQYIRPEILGILLGATLSAVAFKEFRSRGGSSVVVRFILGIFAMIGALVFLGCPWRAFLRLAGGDWNAILGILGLAAGVGIGAVFIRRGYSLGRAHPTAGSLPGWIMPALMLGLLALLVGGFGKLGPEVGDKAAARAPLLLSLAGGLVVGVLAQRSRFCTMGALRDIFIVRDLHLFCGVAAFTVAALLLNVAFGQFHAGWQGQPVAHAEHLWNFLGMTLAGLCFVLAGGCPGRQLILAGEGDNDSGIFVLGMIVGAGVAHNFGLASSPAGHGAFGPAAIAIGIVFSLVVGLTMIQRRRA